MLNSIQKHVRGLLDGAESPFLEPLQAFIQPPVVDYIDAAPAVFIWAATGDERRQTAPRPRSPLDSGGYQKLTWRVELTLLAVVHIDDPNIDAAFPCLVDSVTQILNTCPMPVFVEDPDTTDTTQLLSIGEEVDFDYATSSATGPDGTVLLKYGCHMRVKVEEKLQWPLRG